MSDKVCKYNIGSPEPFLGDKISDSHLHQLCWVLKWEERLCKTITFKVEQLPGR